MSTSYVVQLPDSLRPLLEAEAREHGFPSVSDYVAALIHANTVVETEDPALEQALVDGLRSGDGREADASFWQGLRRRTTEQPDGD